MGFDLPEPDVDLLRRLLRGFPEIDTAIVFGSRAKGNARPGADIDLALKGSEVTDQTVLNLVNALEELPLPYFFDVVAYQDIQNQDLVSHINRVGQVLYRRGETIS